LDAEAVALANGFETANAGGYFVPEGATVALVDFGAAKTLIAVTDGAEYLFREFPVGGTALTEMIAQRLGCGLDEAERLKLDPGEKIDTVKDAIYPGIEDITAEIRTCIENFKTVNDGRQAETTLLSGGLVRFAGIPPLIGRLTKTRAGVFNLFGAFESSDMETATAPYSLDYSIAFGLACHARE
ncbi:MAG: pilus assembly protein PilM, partial [Planctomycetes bacterium]|nr:pilus assembly protein PilM [Planctomycetota bacterium]